MNKKLLTSLGAVTVVVTPIATAVSCSGWTGQKKAIGGSVNISSADKTLWHQLFYSGGRSLPAAGLVLEATVSGQTIKYKWTEADIESVTPQAYLTKAASQEGILSYIAKRMATSGVDASTIYGSFDLGVHDKSGFNDGIDMTTGKDTDTREVATVAGTAKEANMVAIDGVEGWHKLFMSGTPASGTKIALPLDAMYLMNGNSPIAATEPKPIIVPEGYKLANIYKANFRGQLVWAVAKTLLTFSWSTKDDEANLIAPWIAGSGSQGDVVQYVQNKFIGLSPMNIDKITQYIKDNSGGHQIWNELGHVGDRTSGWTFNISHTVDTAATQLKAWHSAFANTSTTQTASRNGRSLPLAGDKFQFTVGTVTHEYVWTASDSKMVEGWLTNEWNQYQVVEYVAAKIAKGNTNILNAVLLSMGKQHLADGGIGSRPAHWPEIEPTQTPITITGKTQWHQLFKNGLPSVGQKMAIVINGQKLVAADAKKEDGTDITEADNKSVVSNVTHTFPLTEGVLSLVKLQSAPAGKGYYTSSVTLKNTNNVNVDRQSIWMIGDYLEFTWTEADSKSTTAINWLNNPTTQSDIVEYVMNKFIVGNESNKDVIKNTIKSVSGGHWILEDLDFIPSRTKTMTFDLKVGNKAITNNDPDVETGTAGINNAWHIAFALDAGHTGRTLPLVGDTFKFADKSYTWTAADNLHLDAWLSFGLNQNYVTEYVAKKLANGNQNYFYGIIELMTRHSHSADGAPVKPTHWTRPSYSSVVSLNGFTTSQPTDYEKVTIGKVYSVTLESKSGNTTYYVEITADEIIPKPTTKVLADWIDYFATILSNPNKVAATTAAIKAELEK